MKETARQTKLPIIRPRIWVITAQYTKKSSHAKSRKITLETFEY